ncbi:putative nuclease HARBI1 isoform X2 [Toxorhynchites rutilus septentrionalis]|uniref:putative nuclease HARBI1 isoform X2 n=1 Tax=Toxorhynchites rutilus septentrionalis TaxID=329112 RepID=UPI002478CFB8|nr:putative nuclease HARBI1 isoform X2 [Toxorhynchites rutilus septentrionalis]
MSIELWFDTDSEDDTDDEEYVNISIERRRIRDTSNPLDQPDKSFIESFRVSKDIYKHLLHIIEANINRVQRFTSVPPTIMLAASLRFFVGGNYQKGVGDDRFIGLAQPTMSKVLQSVLNTIEANVCPDVIQFPSSEQAINAIKNAFYKRTGFPGVMGCIDGTHVSIILPARDKQLYHNSEGFHSLNVMLVCDHTLTIRYLDANHPGSSHKSSAWNDSLLKETLADRYDSGDKNTWLIGDAGFPLEPFLITPFRTDKNTSERQTKFNEIHSKTWVTVKRAIAVLKNTFRCLSAKHLYYKPEKAAQIVNVCVALHNLRIQYKMDFEEPDLSTAKSDADLLSVEEDQNDDDAERTREEIMNSIFTNTMCVNELF